jgi:hypothetical protein
MYLNNFIPVPGPISEHLSFPDPDPNIFHPGSYIKRGMKNKIYPYLFLAPHDFRSNSQ